MSDIRRITYATDFPAASLAAFPHALALARAAGAELTVLHVLPSPATLFIEGGYVPQEVWDQMDASQRAQAAQEMDRLVKQAIDAGVRTTMALVGGGIPAREIARAAEESKTDILVLGTHGRTGVARLFLGSVAAGVVATASCPVLTVRAEDCGAMRVGSLVLSRDRPALTAPPGVLARIRSQRGFGAMFARERLMPAPGLAC